METLGPPDTHFLSAAIGWMELGNLIEARAELGKVAPTLEMHPAVLEVKWAIHAAEKDWSAALQVAEHLVKANAGLANGWLHRAYALRRVPSGGIQAAWDALLPAIDLFPTESTIPYNLACYACQMGNMDEARHWLRRAFAVGETSRIKMMAAADSDLQPLWKELKAW